VTAFVVVVHDARGHGLRRHIGPFATPTEAKRCALSIRALTRDLSGREPPAVRVRVAPLCADADAVLTELMQRDGDREERAS
jgi:hypothetical protein